MPNTPAPMNEMKIFPKIFTGERVPSEDELDPETIFSCVNQDLSEIDTVIKIRKLNGLQNFLFYLICVVT